MEELIENFHLAFAEDARVSEAHNSCRKGVSLVGKKTARVGPSCSCFPGGKALKAIKDKSWATVVALFREPRLKTRCCMQD